jgi:arylsulfatase A-like enzyme
MGADITDRQLREITALYYGHITLIDEHIGRILDKLDKLGLTENTIIAFTADHGELLGAHGMVYKDYMYDESLRIPLLISDAGQQHQAVAESFISQIDIMPTLLDMASVEVPNWTHGMSAKNVIANPQNKLRNSVFAEIGIPCADGSRGYRIGYRNQDYLFSYELNPRTDEAAGELYDLHHDPAQTDNLFAQPEQQARVSKYKENLLHLLMNNRG